MKRLLFLFLLAGCSRGSSDALTFGAAGPWKEGYGAMNRRGIELAQSQINARPERAGSPLQIRFEDDEGSGETASRIAQQFVDTPDVAAVIGHVNSGAMVAAAQVYDGHLGAVATAATSPALTGISSWAFRVISSDSSNGHDIALFASQLGRSRAAILYENNTYGRGLADAFRRAYTGRVVSMDPIGEARGRGLAADLVGGDGWSGLSIDTLRSQGVYVGVPFTAEDSRPQAQRFVGAFTQRFHMRPDNNAALAYDATMLLYVAATNSRGDRRAIRDYLAALTPGTAYQGVTGAISFGTDGDPVGKNVVMTRIDRGTLRVAEAGK